MGADAVPADDLRVVLVTAPPDRAADLARTLVDRRLAACVNILPGVTSVYRWQGAVETGTESLLVVKTRADRLDAVTAAVVELHPYEVPEVLALPVHGGLAAYVDWIRAMAAPDEAGPAPTDP